MARPDCPECGGTGWKIVEGPAAACLDEKDGSQAVAGQAGGARKDSFPAGYEGQTRIAVRCGCGSQDRESQSLARTRIPSRYLHCDFDSFDCEHLYDTEDEGAEAGIATATGTALAWNRSLEQAKINTQAFAREFPVGTEHGLLLMGPCGVGKTHLAVAALREIVLRGHSGLFYDYRELLKEIQDSYNPESPSTEMGVLEPVLSAEILLLDDIGASKPSLWVMETIGHILNARYNAKRITLLTTNFYDAESSWLASLKRTPGSGPAAVEDTLAERIGERMRSRLYEMCRTVEIVSPDYRKKARQAGRYRA